MSAKKSNEGNISSMSDLGRDELACQSWCSRYNLDQLCSDGCLTSSGSGNKCQSRG